MTEGKGALCNVVDHDKDSEVAEDKRGMND